MVNVKLSTTSFDKRFDKTLTNFNPHWTIAISLDWKTPWDTLSDKKEMLKGHRCMQAGHWKEKLRSLAQVEQIPAKQLLTNERVWQRIFEVCVTRSFCKNFTHLGSRALKKNFSSVEFFQDRPLFHWGKMRRCQIRSWRSRLNCDEISQLRNDFLKTDQHTFPREDVTKWLASFL